MSMSLARGVVQVSFQDGIAALSFGKYGLKINPESVLQATTQKYLNLDILILTSIFPMGPAVGMIFL